MNNKTELSRVNKELSSLEEQRAQLSQAQTEASHAIKGEQEAVSKNLMDGAAIDASVQVLARERTRVDGLGTALDSLDAKLSVLRAERVSLEQAVAGEAYERKMADARTKLCGVYKLLYQCESEASGIGQAEKPKGYTPSKEATLTKNMLDQVYIRFDVYRGLVECERLAPELMQTAREALWGPGALGYRRDEPKPVAVKPVAVKSVAAKPAEGVKTNATK